MSSLTNAHCLSITSKFQIRYSIFNYFQDIFIIVLGIGFMTWLKIKNLPSSDYPAIELTISPVYMNKILGGESILPGTLLFTSPELYFVTE